MVDHHLNVGKDITLFTKRVSAAIKLSCFQLNLLVKDEKGDLSTFTTNGEWHLLGKLICIVS
jgi:hypothetical protein